MRPRHRFLTALLALSVLALGGCHGVKKLVPPNLRPPEENTTALDQAKAALQQATPCCSSFADFSYQTLLPWRPKRFELGPGSMVASINGERSYFLSFRLPPDTKLPYRIAIKSELNGRWLRASYLFAPTVTLLDEAFQPVSSEDISLCEHMGWTSETTGAFGSVKVTSKQARYLVLYSSAKQQADSTYWEQSPAAFSAEAPVKMAAAGSFRIPHGPDGTVWVGLMNKSFEDAVDSAICGKAPKGEGVLNTLRTALPVPLWLGADPTNKTNSVDTPAADHPSGDAGQNKTN
ncbi:MalM family protein [Dyella sp. BiH032]|uniref:MalM family protein n=1 Tax=Dyella sp. BiH032 TaxID=3075430 RepID=UPI0028935130|nr:MalM family protein [Dyella sp. BiH032]WNL45098.1 MalM family protein [Dyella sp. BiH032]